METKTLTKGVVIEFWLQPYQRFAKVPIKDKFYFQAYTHIDSDKEIVSERDQIWVGDNFLRDSYIVRDIMDDYDWHLNHDWGIVSVIENKHTHKDRFYTKAKSPDEIKEEKELANFEQNLVSFELNEGDVTFSDESQKLEITLPVLKKPIQLNPMIFYDLIKRETNDVNVTLTNGFGEKILELIHGSFLNAGLADIKVYKSGVTSDQIKNAGYFGKTDLEEGGIFIRKNGTLDIGDTNRTKYLSINLSALIKELHLKGVLIDQKKLINYIKQLSIGTSSGEK